MDRITLTDAKKEYWLKTEDLDKLDGEYVPGFFGVGQGYMLYDVLDLKALTLCKYGKQGLEKQCMSQDKKRQGNKHKKENAEEYESLLAKQKQTKEQLTKLQARLKEDGMEIPIPSK
jgi:hypothetical protein